jgi:nicotinamidase-related amidase
MQTVLHELIEDLPDADVRALQKYWSGEPPREWDLPRDPVLLVVDMTRGFVEDEFPMGWAQTGVPCVQAIAELLAAWRARGLPVMFTHGQAFDHAVEYGEWMRGTAFEAFKERRSDEEHRIVEELAPLPGEPVLPKPKPSAFFATQLDAMLTYLGARGVVVTGMVTSGCVRATVVDAFSLNYRCVVPVECVADRVQASHRVALFDLAFKYADVVRTRDLLRLLHDGDHDRASDARAATAGHRP